MSAMGPTSSKSNDSRLIIEKAYLVTLPSFMIDGGQDTLFYLVGKSII